MKVKFSSSKLYGNKGHQLILLKRTIKKETPFRIPPFTCVDVDSVKKVAAGSNLKSETVKFITAPKRGDVAVRSSGEVSMPGAMETALDVKPNVTTVVEYIKKINDSFESPQCAEYRLANQININGTAVVVMQMVKDPDWSGVCFVDGEDSVSVEGVKGLGDKLVSGKASPEKLPSYLLKSISKMAKCIYNEFGPSDIEWVYKKGKKIQVVQRRDLKKVFNSGELRVELPDSMLIIKGSSIGALTIKSGKPLVLLNDEFTPENYNKILNADVILTLGAGSMSHPALVAKNATGAVVINAVDIHSLRELYNTTDTVLADGNTGCVYKYDPVQAGKHTASGHHRVVRNPDEDVIFANFLRGIFLNGYIYLYHISNILSAVLYEKNNCVLAALEAACTSYILCACLREFRYVYNAATPEIRTEMLLDTSIGNLIKFNRCNVVFFESLKTVSTRKLAKQALERMAYYFNTVTCISGYAGSSWGTVASTLASCILCTYPHTIVLDRLLNLVHNNGSIWGKCTSFDRYGSYFLDKRRIGEYVDLSETVNKFLTIEELKNHA